MLYSNKKEMEMLKIRKSGIVALAATVVLSLGLLTTPAAALELHQGYIECGAGKQLRVNSNTSLGSHKPGNIAFSHSLKNDIAAKWFYTVGYNYSNHGVQGGTWWVSGKANFLTTGAGCVI